MDLDDDPLEVYRREVATVSPLTKKEESHLFKEESQSGERGEIAKKRLLEGYLHLVLPVAEGQAPSHLSMLELIQEGNLGLMRSLEEFPETHLDDFSTYATAYIKRFISDAVKKSKSH